MSFLDFAALVIALALLAYLSAALFKPEWFE